MRFDVFDATALIGAVLTCIGLWLLAPWLACTVAGVILLLVGLLGSRVWVSSPPSGNDASNIEP